jgi:hypothetical protein
MPNNQNFYDKSIRIPKNWVLIELLTNNEVYKINPDLSIYIDTSYDLGYHADIHCKVIQCCEGFDYGGNHPMPWKTKPELQYGDEVVVDFSAIINNLNKTKWSNGTHQVIETEEGQKIRMFVHYCTIWAAKRQDTYFGVNGYHLLIPVGLEVLLKRIDDKTTLSEEFRQKLEYYKNSQNIQMGVVWTPAEPVDYKDHISLPDCGRLHHNMLVLYRAQAHIVVESSMHRSFFPQETLVRVQGRNIIAYAVPNR